MCLKIFKDVPLPEYTGMLRSADVVRMGVIILENTANTSVFGTASKENTEQKKEDAFAMSQHSEVLGTESLTVPVNTSEAACRFAHEAKVREDDGDDDDDDDDDDDVVIIIIIIIIVITIIMTFPLSEST